MGPGDQIADWQMRPDAAITAREATGIAVAVSWAAAHFVTRRQFTRRRAPAQAAQPGEGA